MISKNEIKNILPNIGEVMEQYKSTAPRMVMKAYEDAIIERYKGYLSAFVTESSHINEKEESAIMLSYSFYLVAFIGNGYNYKLFEVIPNQKESPYPIELILYEKNPSNVGEFYSDKEFSDRLVVFFKSSFFNNVINNLVAQVLLYRESREEK